MPAYLFILLNCSHKIFVYNYSTIHILYVCVCVCVHVRVRVRVRVRACVCDLNSITKQHITWYNCYSDILFCC